MCRLIQRIRQNQAGITGLETAIILIAFVIVASVFAYVVLSAGLFSSQKAKEAVTAGIDSTQMTLEVKGNIVAKMESSEVKEIYFFVGIPGAGSPVDFSPPSASNNSTLIISYCDETNMLPSVNWTIQKLSTINDDNLLDPNELFMVSVNMTTGSVSIGPYHKFALEVKPPGGAVLPIERTVPGRISQYVNLH